MATYTAQGVERLLRHYLDIRHTLEGRVGQLPDTYAIKPKARDSTNVPFGQTPSGSPWPFMEPPKAKSPMDGKRKARLLEELHVACLDIEQAIKNLSDDDLELIYKYHIFQTHTLDELMLERGMKSRGSMQQRVYRAVQRLAREMEYAYGNQ